MPAAQVCNAVLTNNNNNRMYKQKQHSYEVPINEMIPVDLILNGQ
jgi:hypothetical protein